MVEVDFSKKHYLNYFQQLFVLQCLLQRLVTAIGSDLIMLIK